ncbi:hypothetical protein ScPMuIL_008335 [Solemya velum]
MDSVIGLSSLHSCETHKQIKNIKNIPTNIKNTGDLHVDPVYLERLGFLNPIPFHTVKTKKHKTEVGSSPVIVSAIEPGKYDQAKTFIKSVQYFLPNLHLVMYDLGLGGSEASQLKKHCNTSRSCIVKKMEFEQYPSHIKDLDIKSYRPICIQEMLTEYDLILWSDSTDSFITGQISQSVEQAIENGILAWTIPQPTSAITHPKMFEYFEMDKENYIFHRAVKASQLIIYNTDHIHKELMLPWVRCSLAEECINPTGAQSVGCKEPKPLYLYSGCHRYDMSALNVILGHMFNYTSKIYAGKEQVFGVLTENGKNNTMPFFNMENSKSRK